VALASALGERRATLDPSPEGKTLEGIDIVTLDVIDAHDPIPTFPNFLHVTTQRYVIARELLLHEGEPYRAVSVEESVRNLRALKQLSLVLAVAVRGRKPGGVRLLVLTKDVWSLRLGWDAEIGPGGIDDLVIQPSETNFLGTHQIASLYFELDPATLTFGAGYHAPRLEGTRNVLDASADFIFNRFSGAPEGTFGQVLADQPLYSARAPWAWDSLVQWDQEISRRFVNAAESSYVATLGAQTYAVPWEFKTRTYLAQESITRSLGWDVKHDFSLGAFADLRAYEPTDALAAYNPAAVSQFVAGNVPRSDDRDGVFVQYHGYRTRFIRVLDFQTLGLQEDYRLGHEVYLRVYPIAKALGSSRNVLGVYAAAAYTLPLADGLVRGFVESLTEAEATELSDGTLDGGAEIVTPRFGIGRLVYDARLISRYRNYLNTETFLGGDTRLRGYPTSFFVGKDVLVSNLELRTRPLEILHTVELGADFFYDAGDAADGLSNLHLVQSVGAGVRALFPQLDRLVFRLDFGVPVGEGARLPGVAPWSSFFTFQQAFTLPELTTAALPSGAPPL
jgi:hypothetical protein